MGGPSRTTIGPSFRGAAVSRAIQTTENVPQEIKNEFLSGLTDENADEALKRFRARSEEFFEGLRQREEELKVARGGGRPSRTVLGGTRAQRSGNILGI